ncbi:TOMM precursor leader peptide-binding protein [Streptomyces montanus]|uniref:TOMM leader peptide-binding protein n=1 Tax=Streptomyces montanus TaxID=2580423 RepID=A0A5R9FE60_9ACTN|nr:TOMM precursor leader peptide-binding protein [Streptomyces montanus]TLS42107.1 TOMM precursor leader peptide-binding protein [Streptomyces montanus]
MNDVTPVVGLLGDGLLRDAVEVWLDKKVRLRDAADLPQDEHDGLVALVLLSDSWTDAPLNSHPGIQVPVLPVTAELGHVVVGPLTSPGTAGCWTCADMRRRRNHPGRYAVVDRNRDALARSPAPWLTPFSTDAVAALVADEITALASGAAPRSAAAFLRVSLEDLAVRTHLVLPEPLCSVCGELPEDTAARGLLTLYPRPKPRPEAFRIRNATDEHQALLRLFVDSEAGLIREVSTGDEGGLPVARAPLPIRGHTAEESGWGRSDSYRAGAATAVLEAVERWGGLQAGGKRTAVRATYREVRETAVDPRTLGLYTPERYQIPDFPFTPFHEDLPMHWVWAHSFARNEPVLLPESYAYYGAHVLRPDEPRLAYEISNGCALGSCLEEAILYGLLEVAERDAFLIAWYARRQVARIDLASARDPRVRMLAAHLEEETSRTITVLDTTVEQGLPCVWAIAVDRTNDGDRARAVCAGGSHLVPERAVLNALCELGPILASVDRSYAQHRRRVTAMAADSSLVQTMGDHSLVYADPSVFCRLEFLFSSPERRSLEAMAARSIPISADDLTKDVRHAIDRYLRTGLDVLVVDQTTLEQRAGGLACVKVVVPGTAPMTFGHEMRRVDGLSRLFDVPRLLGDPAPPSTVAGLNPFPHPFP